jgi:hypothetical protein
MSPKHACLVTASDAQDAVTAAWLQRVPATLPHASVVMKAPQVQSAFMMQCSHREETATTCSQVQLYLPLWEVRGQWRLQFSPFPPSPRDSSAASSFRYS